MNHVHHVHLWSLDERTIHFEAHVGICDMPVSQTNPLREEIERMLSREGINHVTIQFEHMYCDSEDIIGED